MCIGGEAKLIFTGTRGAKYAPFTARPSWDHLTNDRNFGLNRAIPMKSWAMQVVQLCYTAQRRRILSHAQTGRMARSVTPCRHSTHLIHLIAPGRALDIVQAYVIDRPRKLLIV